MKLQMKALTIKETKMKTSIKFLGCLTIVIIVFFAVFKLIRPSSYWEIEFERSTTTEVELSVFLRGNLVRTLIVHDSKHQFLPELVKFNSADKTIPVGELVFADITWPPGRIKIKIGEQLIDLSETSQKVFTDGKNGRANVP